MLENMRFAFQGIWSHKMRSFLTMLGVIIGIASIIGIVSTIEGTNKQMMDNLIGAGNNNVTITLRQGDSDYWMDNGVPDGVSPVSDQQMEDVRGLDHVVDASFYHERTYAGGVANGATTLDSATMDGVDLHYLPTTGYEVSMGRNFIERDFKDFMKVALMDETAAVSLFPEGAATAVGKTITINGEPFEVIGLIRKSENFQPVIESVSDYYTYYGDQYGKILIPDALWPLLYQYDEPASCVARADEPENMSEVGKAAAQIMNESVASQNTGAAEMTEEDMTGEAAEGMEEGAEGTEEMAAAEGAEGADSSAIKYAANDLMEQAKNQQQLAASTNNLLIWIASIALLVGGIGVMNIMLVSVTERTAEIGLKKALGARKRRILSQFLTESVVLTSLGGIIGVVVGIVLAEIISKSSGTPVAISVPAILLSVAFSMLIGIVFGILPARKAANLDPIEALRRE